MISENKLSKIIKESINKVVKENNLRTKVRRIVEDTLNSHYAVLTEDSDNADNQRKMVMKMLKDDKYDHADLSYNLWHPKDDKEKDTFRSKFSKCARGILSFSDQEITKLYQILRKK